MLIGDVLELNQEFLPGLPEFAEGESPPAEEQFLALLLDGFEEGEVLVGRVGVGG